MFRVIGVAGQKRQGKDCIADYLAPSLRTDAGLPWGRGSFAGAVKRIFCDTFQKDACFIEEWKENPECPPGMDLPVRQALQLIGDGFRKIQGNIWIELAFRREYQYENKVFSDCRYINEARKIRDVGGFNILVYRPGYINHDVNLSEAEIRPYVEWCRDVGSEGAIHEWREFQASTQCSSAENDMQFFENLGMFDYFVLNDGTIEQLYNKIDKLIIPQFTKETSECWP